MVPILCIAASGAPAELQEQLNCALRRFCGEGDMKWVSLLMWAGGDPRSRGPVLGRTRRCEQRGRSFHLVENVIRTILEYADFPAALTARTR